jgi:hypothetical protein
MLARLRHGRSLLLNGLAAAPAALPIAFKALQLRSLPQRDRRCAARYQLQPCTTPRAQSDARTVLPRHRTTDHDSSLPNQARSLLVIPACDKSINWTDIAVPSRPGERASAAMALAQQALAPWRARLQSSLAQNKSLAYAKYVQLATVRPDGSPACRTVVFR